MAGKKDFLINLSAASSRLYKRHWLCFSLIAAAYVLPVILTNAFFWGNSEFIMRIINKSSVDALTLFNYGICIILFVYFFLTLAALIRAIGLADEGGSPGVAAAYAQGTRLLDSYLWVKFLFVFKVLCWSLLFVIPGIIFGVFYNFSGMAAAVDGKKGMDALRVSRRIIAPNVPDYLFGVICSLTMAVMASALYILTMDTFIIFFTLRGNYFMASVVDFTEIAFVAAAGTYWLIFYFYLYKALRDRRG